MAVQLRLPSRLSRSASPRLVSRRYSTSTPSEGSPCDVEATGCSAADDLAAAAATTVLLLPLLLLLLKAWHLLSNVVLERAASLHAYIRW